MIDNVLLTNVNYKIYLNLPDVRENIIVELSTINTFMNCLHFTALVVPYMLKYYDR